MQGLFKRLGNPLIKTLTLSHSSGGNFSMKTGLESDIEAPGIFARPPLLPYPCKVTDGVYVAKDLYPVVLCARVSSHGFHRSLLHRHLTWQQLLAI